MPEITKNFTVNVPDELWVDSWEDSATDSYTYVGPDTVYVLREKRSNNISAAPQLEVEPTDVLDTYEVIEIDADANPDIALWIHGYAEDFQHEFETTSSGLGDQTYERITNPHIRDWFDLEVTDTSTVPATISLVANYKEKDTSIELKARNRLKYVKKYSDAYDFDTDAQTAIDTFISNMNDYLATYEPLCPWKFADGIPEGDMPKIPVSLVTVFNSLPEIE